MPHRAPGFSKLMVAKGLWNLLCCFPTLELHVLHTAGQDLLSEGLGPLLGAQTVAVPWPGFLSCLMAAGALNLSRGLRWVLRGQGGSAIPAMCPLSRISSEEKRYPDECSAAKVRAEGKLSDPSACWQSPDGIFVALLAKPAASQLAEREGAVGMCSTLLQLCLQQQGQSAQWQQWGSPGPRNRRVSSSIPAINPALDDGRQL